MRMTFVTVEGHQLAADQADRFLADRERVAREMTALLAPRYARVCRATLNPEDGPGLAAFDAAGVPVFFYPPGPRPRGLRRAGGGRAGGIPGGLPVIACPHKGGTP